MPSHAGQDPGPYQVNLGSSQELAPPYPVTTVVPNSLLGGQRFVYQVLHGTLGASGRLRDIHMTNPNQTLAQQLLPFLADWQFRPATLDRQPLDVEVLLVIPPGS